MSVPENSAKHIEGAQATQPLPFILASDRSSPSRRRIRMAGNTTRGDIMGTSDGLAKYPYISESRRIKAMFTVLEEHVGLENRSIGHRQKRRYHGLLIFMTVSVSDTIGSTFIHHVPEQIILILTLFRSRYLWELLSRSRMKNLIAANKNIGTTHITNGCYRLHPVEWNIGESAGSLVAFAMGKKVIPGAVREKEDLLNEFQDLIRSQGIETQWPV